MSLDDPFQTPYSSVRTSASGRLLAS